MRNLWKTRQKSPTFEEQGCPEANGRYCSQARGRNPRQRDGTQNSGSRCSCRFRQPPGPEPFQVFKPRDAFFLLRVHLEKMKNRSAALKRFFYMSAGGGGVLANQGYLPTRGNRHFRAICRRIKQSGRAQAQQAH